jgi:hypothetical protein
MSLVNIPLTPIPEDDIEKGLLEDDEEDIECICNWNECLYRAPWCRHVASGYVICSVVFCGGLAIVIFIAFLHVLNVF